MKVLEALQVIQIYSLTVAELVTAHSSVSRKSIFKSSLLSHLLKRSHYFILLTCNYSRTEHLLAGMRGTAVVLSDLNFKIILATFSLFWVLLAFDLF